MELVEALGLELPDRQVLLSDEQGWIGTVDFLWRRSSFVLEIDGQWHDGPLDQQADAERDRRIEALGLKVRRVSYRDVVSQSRQVHSRTSGRLWGYCPTIAPTFAWGLGQLRRSTIMAMPWPPPTHMDSIP